ncbi:hypothetical protein BFJ70_g17359 [Fusarium oxysporum]|nr:hypothetical protein BFJ70_g17359 [Fusarium oxysporum]
MQLLATLFFVGTASAYISLVAGRSSAFLALRGVMERQVDFCEPVRTPYTCERSCGPGFVGCIEFPTCYNPGRGDTCCSDGSFCPTGYYCTDAGCCPDENSIEECGATGRLDVIPPLAKEEPSILRSSVKPAATQTRSEVEPATSADVLPTGCNIDGSCSTRSGRNNDDDDINNSTETFNFYLTRTKETISVYPTSTNGDDDQGNTLCKRKGAGGGSHSSGNNNDYDNTSGGSSGGSGCDDLSAGSVITSSLAIILFTVCILLLQS